VLVPEVSCRYLLTRLCSMQEGLKGFIMCTVHTFTCTSNLDDQCLSARASIHI
jgi:hypothetical protein